MEQSTKKKVKRIWAYIMAAGMLIITIVGAKAASTEYNFNDTYNGTNSFGYECAGTGDTWFGNSPQSNATQYPCTTSEINNTKEAGWNLDDGSYVSTVAGSSAQAYISSEFVFNESIESITYLNWSTELDLSTASTCSIFVYNYTRGNWTRVVNAASCGSSPKFSGQFYNPSDVISGGRIYFLMGEHDGNAVTLSNDFFILTINYTPSSDITLPTFNQIPGNQTIEYMTSGAYADFNATDDINFFNYTINDTISFMIVNATGVLQNKTNLPVGTHFVNISIFDNSSNTDSIIYSVNVLDTTGPIFLPLPSNQTLYHHRDSLYLDFNATDLSQVSNFTINDTTFFNISISDGIMQNITKISPGFYTVLVTAKDNYTNNNSVVFSLNITPVSKIYDFTTPWQQNVSTAYSCTIADLQSLPLENSPKPLCVATFTDQTASSKLDYNDADALQTATGNANTRVPYQLFIFNTTNNLGLVQSFNISIENAVSIGESAYIYIWDVFSNSWTLLQTSSIATVNQYNFSSPLDYINESGHILIMAATVGDNNAYIETDHINVSVKYYDTPTTLSYPYFTGIPGNSTLQYLIDSLTVTFNASDDVAISNFTINDTTRFSINNSGHLTNKTLGLGVYHIKVTINDTDNLRNYTVYKVTVQDTINPIFTGIPGNVTLEYKTESLIVIFNASDLAAISNFTVNDTTRFSINSSGHLTNKSLEVGVYNINITINDTSSLKNSTVYKVTVRDTTAPMFSTLPGNITINESSNITADFNATDFSGISMFYINDSFFNITITGELMSNISINSTRDILVSMNDTWSNINSVVFKISFSSVGNGSNSTPAAAGGGGSDKIKSNITIINTICNYNSICDVDSGEHYSNCYCGLNQVCGTEPVSVGDCRVNFENTYNILKKYTDMIDWVTGGVILLAVSSLIIYSYLKDKTDKKIKQLIGGKNV